jgi:hypothetical protein
MTTMMTDLFPYLGSPTTKSIEISHQITWGIGSRLCVPRALIVSPSLHMI